MGARRLDTFACRTVGEVHARSDVKSILWAEWAHTAGGAREIGWWASVRVTREIDECECECECECTCTCECVCECMHMCMVTCGLLLLA